MSILKKLKSLSTGRVVLFSFILFFAVAGISNAITGVLTRRVDYTEVEDGIIYAENEGKTIFTSGIPQLDEAPVDPLTGITADGWVLVRDVEMYQYYIDSSLDESFIGFRTTQEKNIKYKGTLTYENPLFPEDLKDSVFLGSVSLGEGKLKLSDDFIYEVDSHNRPFEEGERIPVTNLKDVDNKYNLKLYTDGKYYSGDPEIHRLGDFRVTYYYIPFDCVKEISVAGMQQGNTIVNTSGSYIGEGAITVSEMLGEITDETDSLAISFLFIAVVLTIIACVSIIKKNKKAGKVYAAALAIILALVITAAPLQMAKADFGDYGGGSDFGGGSYDFGGGYDSGGYDSGGSYGGSSGSSSSSSNYSYTTHDGIGFSTDIYDDIFYYYTVAGALAATKGISSSSIYKDQNDTFVGLLLMIIGGFDIGVAVVRRKRNKNKFKGNNYKPQGPRPQGAARTDIKTLKGMGEYQKLDENFDIEEFKTFCADVYTKLQSAWTAKNLESVRQYLTDAFYEKNDLQLQNYRMNGQTNVVRVLSVSKVEPVGFTQTGALDQIIVNISATLNDYILDDSTGAVVRGNKTDKKHMEYEFSFVRKSGAKTGSAITDGVCPHCGAPISINNATRCEYCDSVLVQDVEDWAINNIKGISQMTTR
ncbi:MAG: TIM44-like domain-containing protein [Clostridia bacterium]|nr:TIM44-like domain-containing protein [Clostridia bacterium]